MTTRHWVLGVYFGQAQINNVSVYKNTIYKVNGAGVLIDHSFSVTGSTYAPNKNFKVYENTIFGAKIGITQIDQSTFTLLQYQPAVAGTGWDNCSVFTRQNAGKCFQSDWNDQTYKNNIYRTSSADPFRLMLHVFSNGTVSNTFNYVNRTPVTGYYKKTNFFGILEGVQGYSNQNVYFNSFGTGIWGTVECGMPGAPPPQGCGKNEISLAQWRQYQSQDLNSSEFLGLISSTVPAAQRCVLYFNPTDVPQTFSVSSCHYRLNVDANGVPSMVPTNGTLTVPARESVILEKNCF